MQCEAIVHKFRLPVQQSLSAFIVPDPFGVLAPDEIFIWADEQTPIDPITQAPISCLLGSVLALRSPCKLPTDIRKMIAVYKPELSHLRNVIVMSANAALCERSPASLLSGGDYDGDTVSLFWDPALVEPFTNADAAGATPPDGFIEENFERELVKGTEVLRGLQGCDEETKMRNLQRYLLAGLGGDGQIGKCKLASFRCSECIDGAELIYADSDWHGNAQYRLGISHPETIRLGRM